MKNRNDLWKYILIVEAILILCLIPFTLKPERELARFSREQITENVYPVGGEYYNTVLPLAGLPRGVIEVRAGYHMPGEDLYSYLWIEQESSDFYSFLGNGVAITPGIKTVSYQVYALEPLENVGIGIQCLNAPALEWVDTLSVYWTPKGYRLLLLLAVFLFALADGIILFRKRPVFWALLACTFLAVVPYMTDYIRSGSDVPELWQSMENVKAYLAGNRMLAIPGKDWVLVFPALLRLFAVPVMNAYKAFVLAVTFATAVFAYAAFRNVTGKNATAMLGVLIYLFYPARLEAVYDRFDAMGTVMAMMMPVALLAAVLLFKMTGRNLNDRTKWIVAAVSTLLGAVLSMKAAETWYGGAILVTLGLVLGAEALAEINAGYRRGILVAILLSVTLIAVFRIDRIAVSGELSRIYSQESVDACFAGDLQ